MNAKTVLESQSSFNVIKFLAVPIWLVWRAIRRIFPKPEVTGEFKEIELLYHQAYGDYCQPDTLFGGHVFENKHPASVFIAAYSVDDRTLSNPATTKKIEALYRQWSRDAKPCDKKPLEGFWGEIESYGRKLLPDKNNKVEEKTGDFSKKTPKQAIVLLHYLWSSLKQEDFSELPLEVKQFLRSKYGS